MVFDLIKYHFQLYISHLVSKQEPVWESDRERCLRNLKNLCSRPSQNLMAITIFGHDDGEFSEKQRIVKPSGRWDSGDIDRNNTSEWVNM